MLHTLCMIFFLKKIPIPFHCTEMKFSIKDFSEKYGLVFLPIDAENAFNSINRKATLHIIKFVSPLICTYICICYAPPARLLTFGGG